jgi:hypothetical protein
MPTHSAVLKIVVADPATDPRWEDFVRTHPDRSIYHHPLWLSALQQEYEQSSVHLACEGSDGKFLAVLPMLYTRGFPFNLGGALSGRRLSSLPRTPLGGPLSTDPEATVALLETAVSLIQREPDVYLQIKTQSTYLDGLVNGLVRTPWRATYVVDLPADPDQLRFGNNVTRHRVKWAVNKATKLGLRVRAAETEAELRQWYRLYLSAMRRNAVPPRPYRFFQSLWRLLRSDHLMQLLLAEQIEGSRRRLLAGSIFLTYGRSVCYAFTGCRKEDLALHPNDLIQWHAIHDACRNGFNRYDFGEVPEEHSELATFKGKWGSHAVPLYRYYYPSPQSSISSAQSPVGRFRRLTAAAWSRLPMTITAILGDRIYSYL